MTTTTEPITVDDLVRQLIDKYAEDAAYMAELPPATTLDGLIDHLTAAGDALDLLGVNGAEKVGDAVRCLTDARDADGGEKAALLRRAGRKLRDLDEMVDEVRVAAGNTSTLAEEED